jgi:hypothetical protein
MKRFTYEITIDAEHEFEAESKIRGLSLLTSCTIIPKRQQASVLPLTETEETLIKYFRRAERIIQLVKRDSTVDALLADLISNYIKEISHEKV